jgi:hypothetical protein
MVARPGLRRPSTQANDPASYGRAINDILRFLQDLPFADGMLFQNQDFGSSATSTKTYQLKHTMGRKAQGILVLNCKAKSATNGNPDGMPSHIAQSDDTSIAYVSLTANMVNNFTWDFWVY